MPDAPLPLPADTTQRACSGTGNGMGVGNLMARTLLVAQPGSAQLLISPLATCALTLTGSGLRIYKTATNEATYSAGPFASCAGGSSLVLQQNGALVLLDSVGQGVWSTDSSCTWPGASAACYSVQVWDWRAACWGRSPAPASLGPPLGRLSLRPGGAGSSLQLARNPDEGWCMPRQGRPPAQAALVPHPFAAPRPPPQLKDDCSLSVLDGSRAAVWTSAGSSYSAAPSSVKQQLVSRAARGLSCLSAALTSPAFLISASYEYQLSLTYDGRARLVGGGGTQLVWQAANLIPAPLGTQKSTLCLASTGDLIVTAGSTQLWRSALGLKVPPGQRVTAEVAPSGQLVIYSATCTLLYATPAPAAKKAGGKAAGTNPTGGGSPPASKVGAWIKAPPPAPQAASGSSSKPVPAAAMTLLPLLASSSSSSSAPPPNPNLKQPPPAFKAPPPAPALLVRPPAPRLGSAGGLTGQPPLPAAGRTAGTRPPPPGKQQTGPPPPKPRLGFVNLQAAPGVVIKLVPR
jgi:hypothetical protein